MDRHSLALSYQTAILAGFAYAILVFIMWGAFNLYSGMPYETALPYTSETGSTLGGFLYRADPLRIHTNTFYHLSYLLGEIFGIGGSYVPFQVVYALLWWARGFLVFLILRKFLPHSIPVCYIAGALVVIHASDGALQWVGQMNQFGFIFWMLLSFYFLILAFDSFDRYLAVLFGIGACSFEYMSLWSYESQILLLLVFALALLLRRGSWQRLTTICIAWYSVPAIYIGLTVIRYTRSAGHSYQESVMRQDWRLRSLFGDLLFNMAASLEFWNWQRGGWKASENQAYLLSLVAALLFAACGVWMIRLVRAKPGASPFPENVWVWWALLAAGFVLLALSFPVYLLLDSARSLWRTQFLSGIGAGLVFCALLGLTTYIFRRQTLETAVVLVLGAVITFFGCASALQKGAEHLWIWERHRAVLLQILHVAPSVRPNAVIVLTNVPKDNDPFRHNMWLDMALRLAYPGIPVAGIYFYADGTPSPGNNLKLAGDRWRWDGTGFPTVFRDSSIANTIVIADGVADQSGLVKSLPMFVCLKDCATQLYNSAAVIAGPISPRTVRRYRTNIAR